MIKAVFGLLIFMAGLCPEVAGQNTILWSVTSPTSSKTSYLLGTYHQMGNSFIDSIPQIKQALTASDLAIFESVDSSGTLVALLNSRAENFDYQKHLKKADLEFLKSYSADWMVPVSKLTPVELLTKLSQEYFKTQCGTVKPTDTWSHFDKYLIHLAKANNIAVAGLETDSLQTGYINAAKKGLTWEKAKKPVHEWIKNIEKTRYTKQYCQSARDYLNFEIDYQFAEQCGNNIMLKGRNDTWMELLPAYLNEHNAFIAVGLMHLKGDCGLIMQLRSRGYTVTPVDLGKASNH